MSPSQASDLALTSPFVNVSSLSPSNASLTAAQSWTCNVQGCNSVTFGRRTELLRHQKKHLASRDFSCAAQQCRRTGQHGFTRKDKLIDHMLAGHDEEDLFACPSFGCTISLPRDLLSLHTKQDTPATRLSLYRVCPMPRCSYRIHAWRKPLDDLRAHIIEQHDQEGRKAYAGLLKERGYDPITVDIVCPLCLCASRSHKDFQKHFLTNHGEIDRWVLQDAGSTNGSLRCPSFDALQTLSALPLVRQERRVILSLWPQFEACPVWDDVKCQSIE